MTDIVNVTDIVKWLRTVEIEDQHWIKCSLAADEIERLRLALRLICDGQRSVEKTYAELFIDVKIEARKALEGK